MSATITAAGCGSSTSSVGQPLAASPSPSSMADDSGLPPDDPADAGAAPAPRPDFCAAAKAGALVDVTKTPQAPYFVHEPDEPAASADTIVFVPGGPGSRDTAQATFELWLARGSTLGRHRVIVPYAADGDLTDEGDRIVPVLDEVLACFGGSRARVHLAGTSNGGRAAFAIMLKSHERFVSLLGAPGLFDNATDAQLTNALAGKAVFNGAGALDAQWRPLVQATDARLRSLGIDSVYVEQPGEGHILDAHANQELFFQFWAAH